jgi:hypothetical protein
VAFDHTGELEFPVGVADHVIDVALVLGRRPKPRLRRDEGDVIGDAGRIVWVQQRADDRLALDPGPVDDRVVDFVGRDIGEP